MINIRIKILLILLFCCFGAIIAQSTNTLDFDEAWEMAKKQNPDYFETLHSLSLATKAVETYFDTFIPQISANAAVGRNSNIYSEDSLSEVERWSFSSGIDTRLTLSTNKKYIQRQEILQYRQLVITAALQEQELYTNLYKLWLRLLFSQEEIDILRGDLINAEKRLEQVQNKYRSGLVSERELLSARLSVAKIKPDIEKQLSQIKRYYIDLKYILGISSDTEIELSTVRPPKSFPSSVIPSDEELNNLLPNSLQLQKAYIQSKISELNLSVTVAENQRPIPSTGVTMGLGWDSSFSDIASGDVFENKQFTDRFTFSIGVDIPISSYIPGSTGYNKTEKAKDDLSVSKRNIKNILTKQLNRLKNLQLDISLSKTNKELNDLSLELQRQNYEVSRRSYQVGSLSFLELEEALQKLRDAEFRYRQQELNYLFLLIDLKNLIASE